MFKRKSTLKGKKLFLVKEESIRYKNGHPNGVNVGSVLQGYAVEEPKIGHQFILIDSEFDPLSWTSSIVAYDEKKKLLTTRNSVYKIYTEKEFFNKLGNAIKEFKPKQK